MTETVYGTGPCPRIIRSLPDPENEGKAIHEECKETCTLIEVNGGNNPYYTVDCPKGCSSISCDQDWVDANGTAA